MLHKMHTVFSNLTNPNKYSWTVAIAALIQPWLHD